MSEFTVLKVKDLEILQDIIEAHPAVLVDFGAPAWCVPCRQLTPHFHYVAEERSDIMFVVVDIDESPEIADRYNILSVPTLSLFENGEFSRFITSRSAVTILKEL